MKIHFKKKKYLLKNFGHYYCNTLYYLNDDTALKSKCEHRARKWAYSVLVPIQKLKDKISKEYIDLYDLADYFEVEPQYMNECLAFYKETGALA